MIAKKYDGSGARRPARLRRTADVVELVVRMAQENPTWGYTRIRGALSNLGHEIGRNTIKRILLEAGIDPAPKRGKTLSWSAFLLGNELIERSIDVAAATGPIQRRKRLGSMLNFYHRAAA